MSWTRGSSEATSRKKLKDMRRKAHTITEIVNLAKRSICKKGFMNGRLDYNYN
jgi:hypothetical protein